MIKTVIKSELKNIFRDKMNVFFVFYPIILGGILYYIIPIIEDSVPPGNPTPEIIIMIMILMIGYIFGAITAFTLLLGYMDTPASRNIAMGVDPDNDLPHLAAQIDSEDFPWSSKYNEWKQTIPCKKIGELNHLADLVEFLSSRAALYLGGSPISFNGGLDKCIL